MVTAGRALLVVLVDLISLFRSESYNMLSTGISSKIYGKIALSYLIQYFVTYKINYYIKYH